MDVTQIGVTAGAVGAVVGAVYAVARLARSVAAFGRRIIDFLDDWGGRPARDGHDAEPGVMDRLRTIEGQVGEHLSAHGQPTNGLPAGRTRRGVG